jgi:hypothetical protein
LRPCCNRLVGQKMSCKFFIASTYDYIRNTCLWLSVLGCFIIIYLQLPMSRWFHELSYPCNARTSSPMPTVFDPTVYYCYYYCFYFTTVVIVYSYHHYKTVVTNKPLRASLFPGAAELTTHLLSLINILWLPLCWINKFGFYFPRRLLRSPILVGHQRALAGPTQTWPKFWLRMSQARRIDSVVSHRWSTLQRSADPIRPV